MWIRRLTLATFIALFSALAAASNDRVMVNVVVTMVKQDSPVQIVGFKLPDKGPFSGKSVGVGCLLEGYCPQVLLHNTTAKEVKFLEIRGILGNPRNNDPEYPRSELEILASQALKSVPQPLIAANGDAAFGDRTLWPFMAVALSVKELQSNCIQFAVIVTRVEFSDGTVWRSDHNQNRILWRNSIRQGYASSCQDSRAVEDAINQLQGAGGGSAPSPLDSGSETVQFYEAACRVRGSVATCDW